MAVVVGKISGSQGDERGCPLAGWLPRCWLSDTSLPPRTLRRSEGCTQMSPRPRDPNSMTVPKGQASGESLVSVALATAQHLSCRTMCGVAQNSSLWLGVQSQFLRRDQAGGWDPIQREWVQDLGYRWQPMQAACHVDLVGLGRNPDI